MGALTIPAYAADTLGESLTVDVPDEWHDRIRALAPRCAYGPNYNRTVLTSLVEMGDLVARGYSIVAYDALLAAERAASR